MRSTEVMMDHMARLYQTDTVTTASFVEEVARLHQLASDLYAAQKRRGFRYHTTDTGGTVPTCIAAILTHAMRMWSDWVDDGPADVVTGARPATTEVSV